MLLVLTALALMGTPGPVTLSMAAVGSAFGARPSLGYLAGACSGTTTILVLVASGFTGIVLAVPVLLPVLGALALAYILYLAWRIATAPPLAERGAGGKAPSFVGGYLLAIANPKAYAVMGALHSSAVLVAGSALSDAAAKMAVLVPLVVAINATWLAFGSIFSAFLSRPRLGRAINIAFAVLLLLSVVAAFLF